MSRKLIVVGNGLGMAIAPEQFGLKPVMQRVWREGLEEDERKLLAKHFRDIDEDNGPSEERHLMVAQVAVMMPELVKCEPISNITDLGDWFSTPSNLDAIKKSLDKYSFEIAKDLFLCSWKKMADARTDACWAENLLCQLYRWKEGLLDFLRDKNSHIATLNYDGFLYQAVIDAGQRTEYLYTDRFKGLPPKWKSYFIESAARYLHLHGSPLFWGEPVPYKLSATSLGDGEAPDEHHIRYDRQPDFTPHIILSDGALKPLLIARSEVLSAYWKELENILLNDDHGERPKEIILFGYGSGDDHLNRLIGQSGCPVRVVERREGNNIPDGEKCWKDKLGATDVVVDLRKNILTFDKWATRPAESKMEDDA
ncbi:hypothetical protein Q4560_14505 [Celeribacter halophilus]|uniref:SIR2-like domain-containing protein n=1 Tax=Celeribacter halophilus TaxID=576117 RepID=A0AAW7XX56_9RHOB|nr:hypothetical protein [Celeribacter halophilus]MDO6457522.1 hypothetical protein [Celeribacter halophilus]MDO6724485.1 hypothetical protein [Celeribacter halophilus]